MQDIHNDIDFFKKLAKFRREGDSHSPDAFNEVARELFGMNVKQAQMLYTKYHNYLTIPFARWKNESIRAYGNAIVPQVMYEIFRAIEQTENENCKQL